MGRECDKCHKHYGIGCEVCPHCGTRNYMYHRVNAEHVVRRAVANADGLNPTDVQRRIVGLQFGDDSAAINERLSDGNH